MNLEYACRIPHRCLLRMQAVYDNLKTAEKNAADYILSHPAEIPGLTVVEFAGRADCSEATIVRFSKRLGYEGFPELKRDFAGQVEPGDGVQYEGIESSDDEETVMRKVFEAASAGLTDTLKVIDREEYGRALRALLSAEKIMFCGVGDAAVVAAEAYQRFVRIGALCHMTADPDLQLILASKLRPGDVLVCISHSGRSASIVNTAKRAGDQGATVVAITNFPVSPLTKRADIVLETAIFTINLTGEVMSKRVAELCIIESLYINFIIRKGSSAAASLKESDASVSLNKL